MNGESGKGGSQGGGECGVMYLSFVIPNEREGYITTTTTLF
jgi:hypothetical protein